jgi:hypothetical protein
MGAGRITETYQIRSCGSMIILEYKDSGEVFNNRRNSIENSDRSGYNQKI